MIRKIRSMRRKSQIGVGSPPFPEIFMRGYGIRLEAWNKISQPLSGSGLELKGAKCQFDPDLLQGHVQFFQIWPWSCPNLAFMEYSGARNHSSSVLQINIQLRYPEPWKFWGFYGDGQPAEKNGSCLVIVLEISRILIPILPFWVPWKFQGNFEKSWNFRVLCWKVILHIFDAFLFMSSQISEIVSGGWSFVVLLSLRG